MFLMVRVLSVLCARGGWPGALIFLLRLMLPRARLRTNAPNRDSAFR